MISQLTLGSVKLLCKKVPIDLIDMLICNQSDLFPSKVLAQCCSNGPKQAAFDNYGVFSAFQY